MAYTSSPREVASPWTSSEKCFGIPLHHQLGGIVGERVWASLRRCFDHKNMSFIDHTSIFFQVIIDQALLCWINNWHITQFGPMLSLLSQATDRRKHEVKAPKAWVLQFKNHMRHERVCWCSLKFDLYNFRFQREIHFSSYWIWLL